MPKKIKLDEFGFQKTDEILTQQEYMVVKSNDIIQKSRFSLSVQQQKIILFLISKIKPGDTLCPYSVSIKDFCEVCNIDPNNGKNYADIKTALKGLADKSIWLRDGNKEILLRWLDRVLIDYQSSNIVVKFHTDMVPFLLELKEKYTQYSLDNILPMRSKYGIRLYELLKSFENYSMTLTFSYDELKQRLDSEKYTRFADFRRFVLEPALNDINTYSDIVVKHRLIKKNSRAYNHIEFRVLAATGNEMKKRMIEKDTKLGRTRAF